MNEIILKTYELIDELDKSSVVKELKLSKEMLITDKHILDMILDYRNTNDPKIKEELYKNEYYKTYMKNYNELFFMVMKINSYYKIVNDKRTCHNEKNEWFFKRK